MSFDIEEKDAFPAWLEFLGALNQLEEDLGGFLEPLVFVYDVVQRSVPMIRIGLFSMILCHGVRFRRETPKALAQGTEGSKDHSRPGPAFRSPCGDVRSQSANSGKPSSSGWFGS